MKKTYFVLFFVPILLVICYFVIVNDFNKSNDIIFYNGNIITMEDGAYTVEAVYVKNGIIRKTGKYEDIIKLKNENTLLKDLNGKVLMPGFIDPHTHPVLSSFLHNMIDLSGFTHQTEEEVWLHLKKNVPKYKEGEWIVCKGLDQILIQDLKSPNIQFLDSIVPNNPLIIISQSLHSYWGNTLAFQKVGVSKDTPDPSVSSYYQKDSKGNLTGLIAEQEAFLPFKEQLIKDIGKKNLINDTLETMQQYAAQGNTSIVSMGITTQDPNVIRLYQHLSQKEPTFINQTLSFLGFLPKREVQIRHFVNIRQDAKQLLPKSPQNGDDFFKILGIKLWYDGSPYIGSMYTDSAYLSSDLVLNELKLPKNHHGKALIAKSDLVDIIKGYSKSGWQIAIHAQGDKAIQEIILAIQGIDKPNNIADKRHRLEHCLLLKEGQIQEIKKLGLLPSFHINHLLYYGNTLKEDLLGEDRTQRILPISAAEVEGIKFSLHADQPMFESAPFSLISTAVNRKTKEGEVIGRNQAIDIHSALKALTINAAYQIKMEDKLGSIKEGKYADFVILDRNPLNSSKEALHSIKVLETIVAGNTVYSQ